MKTYNVDEMFEDKTINRNTRFVRIEDIEYGLLQFRKIISYNEPLQIELDILIKELSQSDEKVKP